MIWLYLKEDIRGAASRRTYGLQGDKVYILQNWNNMFLVVNEKNEKFFVNCKYVCSTYIAKQIIETKIKKK